MMRNLEAKFRLADLSSAHERAQAIGFVLRSTFAQDDTFFAVSNGKLKLRDEPGGTRLIHYRRDASGGLGLSEYTIAAVTDPAATRSILESALGVLARVRKRRTLMLRENIRLHLDQVDQLGDFGEIEAVLAPEDAADPYRAALSEILFRIGVPDRDLITASYFELISRSPKP
jgi:predicted adenylyl cyclase CyaB